MGGACRLDVLIVLGKDLGELSVLQLLLLARTLLRERLGNQLLRLRVRRPLPFVVPVLRGCLHELTEGAEALFLRRLGGSGGVTRRHGLSGLRWRRGLSGSRLQLLVDALALGAQLGQFGASGVGL